MSEDNKSKSRKANKWGERLGAALKENNCALRRAAEIAGVSASVIHSWVHGSVSPTDLLAVKRLCDELNLDFTWLLTGEFSKGRQELSMTEIFEEAPFFDGYAKIRIDRLIPRKKRESAKKT